MGTARIHLDCTKTHFKKQCVTFHTQTSMTYSLDTQDQKHTPSFFILAWCVRPQKAKFVTKKL